MHNKTCDILTSQVKVMHLGEGGGVLPYKNGRGVQPTNSKTHLQYDTFFGTCSTTVVNFDTSSMTA